MKRILLLAVLAALVAVPAAQAKALPASATVMATITSVDANCVVTVYGTWHLPNGSHGPITGAVTLSDGTTSMTNTFGPFPSWDGQYWTTFVLVPSSTHTLTASTVILDKNGAVLAGPAVSDPVTADCSF